MYNIAKVAKGEILVYFNDIFDALSKVRPKARQLAADPELSVKNGAELLDRLVKDTVAEFAASYYSVISQPRDAVDVPGERGTAFSLPRFIPLLSERIHTLPPFTRNYLISWITVLNSIPDLELVSYLPDFLDGLLRYLSDANADVRVGTATVLGDFLREIREAAEIRLRREHDQQRYLEAKGEADGAARGEANEQSGRPSRATSLGAEAWAEALSVNDSGGKGKGVWVPGQGIEVNYAKILEILLPHVMSSGKCLGPEEELQLTALRWINEFILLARDVAVRHTPQLVAAVLPCLAHSVVAIRTAAVETNMNLYRVITEEITTDATPAGKDERGEKKGSGVIWNRREGGFLAAPSSSFSFLRLPGDGQRAHAAFSQRARGNAVSQPGLAHNVAQEGPSEGGVFDPLQRNPDSGRRDVSRPAQNALGLVRGCRAAGPPAAGSDLLPVQRRVFLSPDAQPPIPVQHRPPVTRNARQPDYPPALPQPQPREDIPDRLEAKVLVAGPLAVHTRQDLEFASMMVQNLNIILITAPELVDVRRTLRNLDSAVSSIPPTHPRRGPRFG
ncbi:MAG: hypothetical protein BJ554DRAFT_3172 [Olpidium bornovanus]|uniref:Vacuolar protein 14 C-terminal Fig4-binding domain-containing protein n=1 Tax=Olpidium bornovanus TaxID=278681 RepID=A0A8H7ZP68_9FUNG|nr:MAG: hypothetical protein BJ554DRAFT_3172 [Olpidium bornovanus]